MPSTRKDEFLSPSRPDDDAASLRSASDQDSDSEDDEIVGAARSTLELNESRRGAQEDLLWRPGQWQQRQDWQEREEEAEEGAATSGEEEAQRRRQRRWRVDVRDGGRFQRQLWILHAFVGLRPPEVGHY